MSTAGVTVRLFPKGKRDVLNGKATVAAVGRAAQSIAQMATSAAGVRGALYRADSGQAGKNRAHGIVHTANFAAMIDQHRHHTLNRWG